MPRRPTSPERRSTAPSGGCRPAPARPLLTASLIVRDESAFLDGCLASLAGSVDEIVIVDTGSTDDTLAIAERHGARIFHHRWTGDFAEARNVALARSRGAWILYIDADERLRPIARSRLDALLCAEDAVAYRVRLVASPRVTGYWEHRLFRNDPRIRFEGAIHERVPPSIRAVARTDGQVIRDAADFVLDHFGYEGDQAHKHRRDRPLLEAHIARDPGRIYVWWHLGRIRHDEGDVAGAVAAWTRALDLSRAAPVMTTEILLPVIELIRHRIGAGDPWFDLLDEWRPRFPGHRLLDWFHARRLMDEARWNEALAVLTDLAAVDPDALVDEYGGYDRRIFGAFAREALGTVLFNLGRFAESAAAYGRAEAAEGASAGIALRRQVAEMRARRAAADAGG